MLNNAPSQGDRGRIVFGFIFLFALCIAGMIIFLD